MSCVLEGFTPNENAGHLPPKKASRLGQENVNFVKKAMSQMRLAYGGCT